MLNQHSIAVEVHCNCRFRICFHMQFHKKQDSKPQDESRGGLVKRVAEVERSTAQNDFAYTMFAATRSRRRALIRFVRMADLMLGSALRSVLMSSCQCVVRMLHDRQNSVSDPPTVFHCHNLPPDTSRHKPWRGL